MKYWNSIAASASAMHGNPRFRVWIVGGCEASFLAVPDEVLEQRKGDLQRGRPGLERGLGGLPVWLIMFSRLCADN